MIEHVPIKNRPMVPGLISTDSRQDLKKEKKNKESASEKRQQHLANMINNIPDSQKTQEMGIWEAARTPNSFSVNAQQALDPFTKLQNEKNASVMFFDIEAIGTPEKMRGKGSTDFFSVTELSFGRTVYNNGSFDPKGDIVSMAIAPGETEYNQMKAMIKKLKENPLAGITKDDHRSLLDLIKYSDESVFSDTAINGQPYTRLKGHKRVPAPLSALTSKTLEEIELGLDNLYKRGVSIDHALDIFKQSVVESSSRLGGYNIHSYDLPALMGATKNKATQKFLKDVSSNSLDFYHSYSAVATNPFTLTGGSTRQEHIHQYLLQRNMITNPALSSYQYHLAKDDILANIEIAGFTTNKVFDFLEKASADAGYALDASQISTKALKVGQEVFSFQSGYFNPDKHEHNLIGRIRYKKDEKGKYVLDKKGNRIEEGVDPRWKNLDTSTPSNERFVIKNFFEGVTLPGSDGKEGKIGYGVRLDSKDIEGKTVMLFSETKEDLAQQIHNSFLSLDSVAAKEFRKLKAEIDQPFDEYSKMFRDGGFSKMEQLYGYLNGPDAPSKHQGNMSAEVWKKKWTDYILEKGGTDELSLRIPHMVERLVAEEDIWSQVMTDLNQRGLSNKQKDMAVRHVKNELGNVLDESGNIIGTNKSEVDANGHKLFNFAFGKDKEVVFNAKDTDSIKGKFRQFINGRLTGEYKGTPEESYRVNQINRLSDMIIDQFGFNQNGTEAKKVKDIAKGMIGQVQSGGKIETALTEISNMVRERIVSKGTSKLNRERTDVVTKSYGQAISTFRYKLPEVLGDAVKHAESLVGVADGFGENTQVGKFVQQQDERIQELFKRNFRLGNTQKTVGEAGQAAAKYGELLMGIVKDYSASYDTQIYFREGKGKAPIPYLVLNEKGSDIAQRGVRTLEDMMMDSRTAVVELPWMDEDLMINMGSQRKIPVMRSKPGKGGELIHTTNLTDALSSMRNQAGEKLSQIKLKEKIGISKNPLFEVQRGLKYAARRHVDPVASESSRRLNSDESKLYDGPSKTSMKTKGGYWDYTDFAEEWYRKKAVEFGFAKNTEHAIILANKKAQRAEENNKTFYDMLTAKEKAMADLGGLHEHVSERTGLVGSVHGLNTTAVGKGLGGTTQSDARRRIAGGYLLGDAGENPLKVVNYRHLDEEYASSTLEKAKRHGSYRTSSTLIASDEYNESQGIMRGLTMKTAYMSDEELAMPLRDQERIQKYDKWIDKAVEDERINEKQAREMKRKLRNGVFSTSEGMAVMDIELAAAYDGWDEVRIGDFKAQGDDVTLHKTIEDAIQEQAVKQGLAENESDKRWKKTGIEFEKPLVLNDGQMEELFGGSDTVTVGKYVRNGITQNVVEDRRLRRDKQVAILGFNTDEAGKSTLVLGRKRTSGHGTKIVTENGFRATVDLLLREIIEDVSGVKGAEFIRSNLKGEKKRTNNAFDYIRGIDVDIRQQFAGEVTKSKALEKYDSVESALDSFYKEVGEQLGIKTEIQANGVRTVSSDWGYDHAGGKENPLLSKKEYEDLMNKWNKDLGNEGRWVAATEVRAHNVDTNFGKQNVGKITIKEVDMLNHAAVQYGIIEPGEKSAIATWLMDKAFGDNASPEVKAKQKVFGEIVKVMGDRHQGKWTPGAGDAVIDYTSEVNAITGDKLYSVDDKGVIHLSKDAYLPSIERENERQMITVGDHNKTVINAEGLVIGEKMVDNQKTSPVTLGDYMREQAAERGAVKGTTYLKLPEEFKHQYIPIIDAERYPTAGNFKDYEEFLDTIHGKYAKIDRLMRSYNDIHLTEGVSDEDISKLKKKHVSDIDSTVSELLDAFADTTSGDGSSDFMSARLNNSTRLQSASVNPALAYKKDSTGKWVNRGPYEEATQYINPHDARRGIEGIEENIAKAWDIDLTKVDGDLGDYLIARWNEYNTYGVSNRNPTIHHNTIQVNRIMIDETVGRGQMRSLRGTQERFKEDNDGDAKALFKSFYGEEDTDLRNKMIAEAEMHYEANKIHASRRTQKQMMEVEESFTEALVGALNKNSAINGGMSFTTNHEQVQGMVSQIFGDGEMNIEKMTLGTLRGQDAYDYAAGILKAEHEKLDFYEEWGLSKAGSSTAQGISESKHTHLARVTHGVIGKADNLRLKMENNFRERAEILYKHIDGYSSAKYRMDNAMVHEFFREISQNAISSKHASGADIYENIEELYGILDDIANVKNMDKRQIENLGQKILDRGFFKGDIHLGIGKEGYTWGETGSSEGKNKLDYITKTLTMVGESEMDAASVGVDIRNSSASFGSSMGGTEADLTKTIQHGSHNFNTYNQYLANVANEQGHSAMLEAREQIEAKLVRLQENRLLNREDRFADAGAAADIINNRGVPKPQILANDGVAIQRTMKDSVQDTFSDIATKTKHVFNGSAAAMGSIAGLSFAGLWATNALMKGAPTPEGMQEMAPVNPDVMTQPTARVTPNESGEYINISVSAKTAKSLNTNDLAAMLNNEIMAMSNISMRTHVNVNDNSANIDQRFVEGAVANAMTKGYAY